MSDRSALPPEATGAHLDKRHQVADGAGEGSGVALGPPLLQEHTELLGGARSFLEQRAGGGDERLDVRTVGTVGAQAAV
jgi:hypothetical protein